jgi:hypothetical protein
MSVVFTVLVLAGEEKVIWTVEFGATWVVPLAGTLLDTENEEVDGLLGVEDVLVVEALLLPQPARITEKIDATNVIKTAANNLRFMTPPLRESMEHHANERSVRESVPLWPKICCIDPEDTMEHQLKCLSRASSISSHGLGCPQRFPGMLSPGRPPRMKRAEIFTRSTLELAFRTGSTE